MNKIILGILLVIVLQLAACVPVSPVFAQEYPLPPMSSEESWQPPYGGEAQLEPSVGVQVYDQAWPDLPISFPTSIVPGHPSSIISAYLVNSQGQILTELHRNEVCYLIISFNGPGNFYLWEYYPAGTVPYGHWLSYNWYRPGSGIWRIGPFAAEPSDPIGHYTWKLWYLSGYTWSTRSLGFKYTGGYYPPDIPGLKPYPLPSPVINSFIANKPSIDVGETAVLTWTTTNAVSATISPNIGTVAASGSTSVTPTSTTTYTLVAKGKSGDTVSSTATITVMPRVSPTISTGETTIQRGKSTYLTWNAPKAVRVSITGIGNVETIGSRVISPEETTTYSLSATYIDGSVQSASVTVNVEQPPYLLWGLIALVAIAIIIILILVFRRPKKEQPIPSTETRAAMTQTAPALRSEDTRSTDTLPATIPVIEIVPAKLIMSTGKEIMLAGNARTFGRREFESSIPPDYVTYVSRQHFNIWFENGTYYIEDRSSTNGTKINGIDIKGTGRHALADGDVIELAGKVNITFKVNQ